MLSIDDGNSFFKQWQMIVSSLPSPPFPSPHKNVTLNFIISIVIECTTFSNGTPCLSLLDIRFGTSSPAYLLTTVLIGLVASKHTQSTKHLNLSPRGQ
jgi:hypothetical protein